MSRVNPGPGRQTKWTPALDAKLWAGRQAKKPFADIARSLGLQTSACEVRFRKLRSLATGRTKFTREGYRMYTGDEDAQILELREGGATWNDIGKALDRTEGSVQARWNNLTGHGKHRDVEQYQPLPGALAPWPEHAVFTSMVMKPCRPAVKLEAYTVIADTRSLSGNAAGLCAR
jgi:hypothetical protein